MEQQKTPEDDKKGQGFLVLSVNMKDHIQIGEDIFIQVKERRGNLVRVAVKAPKNLRVERVHKTEG